MGSKESLVDIILELGEPPQNVDIETFAIAKVPPDKLTKAIDSTVPPRGLVEQILHEEPDSIFRASNELNPEKRLGQEIRLKQQLLTKSKRVAATLLAATTMSSGSALVVYEKNHDQIESATEIKETAVLFTEIVLVGGVVGFTGGIIADTALMGMAPRLARKPAQKIVRRAEQEST